MVSQAEPTRSIVLFVEDEPILRGVMTEELEAAGYQVLAAADGAEALALLRAAPERIDILFTDIRLPGPLNGWHLAFEYRFHHPFRPVVYATAYPGTLGTQVFGSLLIRKPYRPGEVLAAFERLRSEAVPQPAPLKPAA